MDLYPAAARAAGMHAHGNYAKRISAYRRTRGAIYGLIAPRVRHGLGLVPSSKPARNAQRQTQLRRPSLVRNSGRNGGSKIILPFRNNPCDPDGERVWPGRPSFGKAPRPALISSARKPPPWLQKRTRQLPPNPRIP